MDRHGRYQRVVQDRSHPRNQRYLSSQLGKRQTAAHKVVALELFIAKVVDEMIPERAGLL
jgi:hypothetical protein